MKMIMKTNMNIRQVSRSFSQGGFHSASAGRLLPKSASWSRGHYWFSSWRNLLAFRSISF